MRRCATCGGESGDRSQYCFHCGAPLDLQAASTGPGPSAGAPTGGDGLPALQPPDPTVPERPGYLRAPGPGAVGTTPEDATAGRQRIETAPTAAVVPGAGEPLSDLVRRAAASPARAAIVPSPPGAAAMVQPAGAGPAAGWGAAPSGDVPPGTVVDGKYTIERVLGEGGMGVVYLARENATGIEVVLKAIRPEVAHRADTRARMLSEGQALARIDHPNVVQLKAVVEQGNGLWLVMQYVAGESLEQAIARYADHGAYMPLAEAVSTFRQIVAGVAAAHREGLIHRDLKPANILIRRKDAVIKVTDFGIAKVEEDAIAGRGQTRGFIGSPHYTSPEQVLGRPDLDRRVDIYALGIVLFEMLTNRVPFDADSAFEVMRMHADTAMPRVSSLRPEVSRDLDAVIRQACAKNRDQRYQRAEELLAAVLSALPGFGVPSTLDDVAPLAARPAGSTEPAMPAAAPPGQWGPSPAPLPDASYGQGYPARPGTITGQATALPASSGGSPWGWVFAIGGFLVLLGGIGGLAAFGVFSSSDPAAVDATEQPTTEPAPSSSAAPSQEPTFQAADSTAAFEPLVGRWSSDNGRLVEAVTVGDTLEFRVLDASQFTSQEYRTGEARFVLRTVPTSSTTFAVEDRVRPLPPDGYAYDPQRSRNTCLSVRTEASGKPLQAVVEGERMTVDFAKLEPRASNFTFQGSQITSCRGLEALRAVRAPLVLHRVR